MIATKKQRFRRRAGFSLIEMIMVIVVLGVIAAVAAPALSNAFRAYFTGKDIAENRLAGEGGT